MYEIAVDVNQLVKRYPKVPVNAVDAISLSVRRGEIFGLLGPNGAGKTTTISMLTTLMLPTSGSISIMGIDPVRYPAKVKRHIAVVPQRSNLDQSLTARDILIFHAAYHNVPHDIRETRADTLLTELGLEERARQKLQYYSGGMAQRIMLARALMHSPDVIFLDEPTSNLDPQSRHFLWERILALRNQGMTVVLTTHDMVEAERLCDRIAVMDYGHILVLGTVAELKQKVPHQLRLDITFHFPSGSSASADTFCQRLLPSVKAERVNSREDTPPDTYSFQLYGDQLESHIPSIMRITNDIGAELRDLHLVYPGLEEVFIHLTGRELRS